MHLAKGKGVTELGGEGMGRRGRQGDTAITPMDGGHVGSISKCNFSRP